ncbi:MAG TPA: Holliday junction branch migration protein RuvA [Halanaerobiales bacterium]|nr:Holliday junction branch migration protein RuvA [Halanaerobiales bacterium]
MIGHLKGKIIYSNAESIIVDVNGVGYQLKVPTLYPKKDINKNIELFVYTYIREDALDLYGFETAEEKKLFKTLLSVSRVGPSAAMNILSTLAYERFINAILSENVSVLKEVSGIGPKTAQRLILELKSKIEDMLPELQIEKGKSMKKYDEDLYEALTQLGYTNKEVDEAVNKLELDSDMKLEDKIKNVLSYLGREH